jgi:hypothetical protein
LGAQAHSRHRGLTSNEMAITIGDDKGLLIPIRPIELFWYCIFFSSRLSISAQQNELFIFIRK